MDTLESLPREALVRVLSELSLSEMCTVGLAARFIASAVPLAICAIERVRLPPTISKDAVRALRRHTMNQLSRLDLSQCAWPVIEEFCRNPLPKLSDFRLKKVSPLQLPLHTVSMHWLLAAAGARSNRLRSHFGQHLHHLVAVCKLAGKDFPPRDRCSSRWDAHCCNPTGTGMSDEGAVFLGSLPNLTSLDCSRCSLSDAGISGLLQGFPKGQQLNLYGCKLLTKISLRALTHHRTFCSLTLSGWSVRNWALLAGSKRLTSLDLSIPLCSLSVAESVVCAVVQQSPRLVSLRLTGLLSIAHAALVAVSGLSHLSLLALGGCGGVRDGDLMLLAQGCCRSSLRRLLLPHSAPLGAEVVQALAASCPLLRSLDISGAAACPTTIRMLHALEMLVWKGVDLGSGGLKAAGLAQLTSVKWLDLSGCHISSDAVVVISLLPVLEDLVLCGRHPTGITPPLFAQIEPLTSGQIYGDGVQYRAAELFSANEPTAGRMATTPSLVQQRANARRAFPVLKSCTLDCNSNAQLLLASLAFDSECSRLGSLSIANVRVDDVISAYLVSIAKRANGLAKLTVTFAESSSAEVPFWVELLNKCGCSVVNTMATSRN